MNDPPSQPSVSVEETEKGYIVRAGSAVARISKTGLGYAVDADSQVLKKEYDLSPGVEKVRKSAHATVQFSEDPTDETRLILRATRSFLLLSQAVEMVCGFRPEHFPREIEWKSLTSWKSVPQIQAKPKLNDETGAVGESTDDTQLSPKQLTKQTESASTLAAFKIHQAVSKLPRYRFDKSTKIDVEDGLLIVFEDGEKYGEYDRIVYIGINKKSGRLPGRVTEFISGKKDGVILRKYIGAALLIKNKSPYARIWLKDASSPEKLRRIGTFYDPKMEEKTEGDVSSYLNTHMSFSVIEINKSKNRTLAQNGLISTLRSAYSQLPVSKKWLGNYNPEPNIRTGRLWMKGSDNVRPFTEEELNYFLNEVTRSRKLQSPSVTDVEQTPVGSHPSVHDSMMRVTVSLSDSSYEVHFRNVVAKITPVDNGYSLDIGSQIFNKDIYLSDKIRDVRSAIRTYHSLWKEVDTNDEILTLRSPFVFPHMSDALETICGCVVCDVPYDRVFKSLDFWVGTVYDGIDIKDSDSQDILDEKESADLDEGTYFSWTALTQDSVMKTVDKSCLDHRGSAIPTGLRSFFNADSMKKGDIQKVCLLYGGERFAAKITANVHMRVRVFWFSDLGQKIKEYCKLHPVDPVILFKKGTVAHEYLISFMSKYEALRTRTPEYPVLSADEPKPEYVTETEDEFLKDAVIMDGYLVKKITQTVISSKKIVLLTPCLPFFAAEDMKFGEERRITIKYDGKEGTAQIYKNNTTGRYAHSTALNWDDALNAYIKQMTRDEGNEMYFILEKSILGDNTYRLRIENIS